MNNRKHLHFCLLFLAPIFAFSLQLNAQKEPGKKEQKLAQMQKLVEGRNFVFVAQYANPLGGRNINLTSLYDLKIYNDTIMAELPYFGRAFVAPINSTDGGINFTTTKFNYKVNPKKKGGWDISIEPKDGGDVREMFLSISESGYASLQVTSNNRQGIGFTGYLTSREKL